MFYTLKTVLLRTQATSVDKSKIATALNCHRQQNLGGAEGEQPQFKKCFHHTLYFTIIPRLKVTPLIGYHELLELRPQYQVMYVCMSLLLVII
jgi:hypothetical protein